MNDQLPMPQQLIGSTEAVTVDVVDRQHWAPYGSDYVGVGFDVSEWMYWYPARGVFADAKPGDRVTLVPAKDIP